MSSFFEQPSKSQVFPLFTEEKVKINFEKKLKIAHISDLHFFIPTYNPKMFFSKRWLGVFNSLFTRKKENFEQRLQQLLEEIQKNEVDYVVITGDLTTTSLPQEFLKASSFVHEISKIVKEVFLIPGNHDHYTKSAYEAKIFYQFFPSIYPQAFTTKNLKDHGVTAKKIEDKLWLVLLDTTLATHWVSSEGLYSEEIEKHLLELLDQLPKGEDIILCSHFPLFSVDRKLKALLRRQKLRQDLSCHRILMYLHGHSHRNSIADLRGNHLPIVCDAGSAFVGRAGAWNLIELNKSAVKIQRYEFKDNWLSQEEILL